MKKICILSAIIMSLSCEKTKHELIVKEIDNAIEIYDGYALVETDETFQLGQSKYLIKTKGFFDKKGDITHIMVWDALGYVNWSKKDFRPFRDFLEEHDMFSSVNADLVNNRRLIINTDTAIINAIDSNNKVIYYNLTRDRNSKGPTRFHRVIYK